MDHLPTPIGPSAEIPLLEGYRLKFAEAIRDGKSAWVLTTMFTGFISELEQLEKTRDIKLDATMALLAGVGGLSTPGDSWDVFHSIPRDLLGSVILGTVAFDSGRPQNRVTGLSDDAPGIYVLGLSISGRDGKFINANELKVLIGNLKTYVRGYRYQLEGAPSVEAGDAAAELVAEVDGAYGAPATPGTPRFICDKVNLLAAKPLLKSLIKRYNIMIQQDPTGTVYSIQSPQYVGCSKDVRTRIAAYELGHHASALTRANKFYSLIASLLWCQGLTPKVHAVTAIRTWAKAQLPKAEMLLAALAGAYVIQGGFNLREAGGNYEHQVAGTWRTQEQYVFTEVSHMSENMQRSAEDLEKTKQYREHEKALDTLDDGTLQQDVDDCRGEMDVLAARVEEVRQLKADVEAENVDGTEYTSKMDTSIEVMTDVNSFLVAFRKLVDKKLEDLE